jgi:hypothetical protein
VSTVSGSVNSAGMVKERVKWCREVSVMERVVSWMGNGHGGGIDWPTDMKVTWRN